MINREGDTDWEAYSMACADDGPGPAFPLAQMLSEHETPFIIVSARSECARYLTLEWLRKRQIYPWAVFLCDERHDGSISHGQWKALKLQEIQDQFGWEILYHVDDATEVSKEVRAIGIPVMLVRGERFTDLLG